MTHYHCIVWIDHAEARLFSFNRDDVEPLRVHARKLGGHLHHKAGSIGSGKAVAGSEFLTAVEAELRKCGEFLVVGPGTAKLELVRHIHKHAPDLDPKLVAVETVDHPTDRQVVAYARKYFVAADRMLHSNAEVIRDLL
jgi:stalled ribosome rescue protein Dom34